MSGIPQPGRAAERGAAQIFAVPLALALLTGFGLTAALLGEGGWHLAAWIALAMPLALTVWCLRPRR
jgi:hypothetical protein